MWTLSSAPTWEIGAEIVQLNVIIIVIKIVVVVDDDYWVYLSYDHLFQVYYQVR